MKRRAARLALAALAGLALWPESGARADGPLSAGPVQQAAIFEDDDSREMTRAERARYGAVGVIRSTRLGYRAQAMAVVVLRPNLAVTTAHVLYGERGLPRAPLDTWQVVLADGDGGTAAHPVTEVRIGSRYPELAPWADWAVLLLANPAGPHIVPLDLPPADAPPPAVADMPVVQVGYRGYFDADFTYRLDDCRLRQPGALNPLRIQAGARIHDCDTEAGESGSPLIVTTDGRDILIGVHAGDYRSLAWDGDGFEPSFNFNYAIAPEGEMLQAILELAGAAAPR